MRLNRFLALAATLGFMATSVIAGEPVRHDPVSPQRDQASEARFQRLPNAQPSAQRSLMQRTNGFCDNARNCYGNRCITNVGWCWLPNYDYVNSPCTCFFGGWAYGGVTRP